MIIDLIELGLIDYDFIQGVGLRDPVAAIKQVARDLTCKEQALDGLDGRLSAIYIQRKYFDLALRHKDLLNPQYLPLSNFPISSLKR